MNQSKTQGTSPLGFLTSGLRALETASPVLNRVGQALFISKKSSSYSLISKEHLPRPDYRYPKAHERPIQKLVLLVTNEIYIKNASIYG